MITSFILYLIYGFVFLVTSPFRLFSDVTLDNAIVQAFSSAGAYLAVINQVFPVYDLLAALGIMGALEIGIKLYESTIFTIRKIPGVK